MNKGRSRSDPEPRSSSTAGLPVVHSITGAAQAHSDDMDARIKRYLVSMGIRTVCVVLVLVLDGPIRWVFAVLAVILPYVAVVMANVAGGGRRSSVPAVTPVPLTQLRPESSAANPVTTPGLSTERPIGDSTERTA